MELMVAEIFIKAFVLCALLYLVARHEADFQFAKVAIVTAGITLGSFFIEVLLVDRIGLWTVFPIIAFILFMIVKFCWVSFWKGLVVTVLFMTFNIALAAAVQTFLGGVSQAVDKAVQSASDQGDMKQAMEAFKDVARAMGAEGGTAGVPASVSADTSAPPAAAAAAPDKPAAAPAPAEVLPAAPGLQALPGFPFAPPDSPGWAISKNKLKVTATMMERGRMIAVVNSREVGVGSIVVVVHEKQAYPWRVASIARGEVNWEPVLTR